ncbi:MAG: hypothetical protein NTY77_14195 [Elusimicrobia bacterium]|nr:hypothetical protein [Elusimicrobiota bacterium]
MALDEATLVLCPEGSVVLRFFRWAGPALTFGYSQNWATASAAAQAAGIPTSQTVRRATGGGIVFHDGDLTFSMVFPWPRLSPPLRVYEGIHRGVLGGLQGLGLEAVMAQTPAAQRQSRCFAGPEAFDIVDGSGRKLLGGALRRRLGRGLYQGSLRAAGREGLEAAMGEGLAREWGPLTFSVDGSWLAAAEALAEKYASDSWNRRR